MKGELELSQEAWDSDDDMLEQEFAVGDQIDF